MKAGMFVSMILLEVTDHMILRGCGFSMTLMVVMVAAVGVAQMVNASGRYLTNGDVWKDTDGVQINAHGGALMKDGDTWYWHGEHKTEGARGNKAWVGVRCYSSRNLVDWKNEGVAFKVADAKDIMANPELAAIEAGCVIERPKVVKAQDGSRFVMFFHLELKGQGYRSAQTGIAQAKTPVGPFTLFWHGRPNAGQSPIGASVTGSKSRWRRDLDGGQMSRDMTLFVDPKDGTVFHIFASEDNASLHLAEVRADGLGYTGRWARLTYDDWTEAPALVAHGGWYYLIGSGCTGWRPNAARAYRAKSVWGPWQLQGNPCRGGEHPEITWGGQSTGIFEIDGRLFAMFDVWRPGNAQDGRYLWMPISIDEHGEMMIRYRSTFHPRER